LNKYGPGKVTAYLLFGHSDGESINLDYGGWGKNQTLTMEDIIKLDVFGKRSGEHAKHPTIILNSCSTGQKLAKHISKYFGARVFAPLVPARIKWIQVDKSGKIEGVRYSDSSIIFDRGKIVQVVEPRDF
jgi:hypothetical protein